MSRSNLCSLYSINGPSPSIAFDFLMRAARPPHQRFLRRIDAPADGEEAAEGGVDFASDEPISARLIFPSGNYRIGRLEII